MILTAIILLDQDSAFPGWWALPLDGRRVSGNDGGT